MKKALHKKWLVPLIPLIAGALTLALLLVLVPKAQPHIGSQKITDPYGDNKELLKYVAIGDSLTEGIGDSTAAGGFVPIVAKDIQERYRLNAVEIENFGKNGDRSDQILSRIKKQEAIQKQIGEADFITLTVGGNDLMKVIKGDIFNLTVDSFEKPLKKYQQTLTSLLEEIRKYNETAPVYVLGIYNPFYLYFSDIVEMQQIVDNWNDGTANVVQKQAFMHFIPINDLLYKGVDGVGITEAEGSTTSSDGEIVNNAIYEEDHFHPNNLGYQLMANAVRENLIETKNEWLLKGADE